MLKHGKHVLPYAREVLALLAGSDGRLARPVPFLLMTNGGGMPESERVKALERDFGQSVGGNSNQH